MKKFHTGSKCIGINISCFHLIRLLISFAAIRQSDAIGIRAPTDLQSSSIPNSPPHVGVNFAKGSIDLGGLIVTQISNFKLVWKTQERGPENHGAKFYEPLDLPDGYFIIGHYSKTNKKSLTGRVLVVRDDANGAVAKPLRYTLLWRSENSNLRQKRFGYVWQPVAPKGYKALGHIVTTTPKMPDSDKVRCVRDDFVEECSHGDWIWGAGEDGFDIVEGMSDLSVPVGTFKAVLSDLAGSDSVQCLKNSNLVESSLPNMDQIKALMASYGPVVYLHPDEQYSLSSVDWFFNNGALLYQRGNEANPVKIDPTGSNLPQNGSNDGAFWIDLPVDGNARGLVMGGEMASAKGYLHVKPMLGGTVTDLAIWLFYPYNGPAKAKVLFFNINLSPIGSHVGDWEHVTLRINNLDGKLQSVYFGQHEKGQWVNAPDLEYANGNKPIAYSSRNGHAMFPHGGLVMQGNNRIGTRNDMAKSNIFIDTGSNFEVISAEYLGIIEPPWLNYFGKWGPKLNYKIQEVLHSLEKVLIFKKLKRKFESFVNGLPSEILGQEGPTGPKVKASWKGDEQY